MFPAVPVPENAPIRIPIEFTLKAGWRYDRRQRVFTSDSVEPFAIKGCLPSKSRIVYQVPSLAEVDPQQLDDAERDLQRYMHIILPRDESPQKYVDIVKAWPCVAEAHVGPDVSLPQGDG